MATKSGFDISDDEPLRHIPDAAYGRTGLSAARSLVRRAAGADAAAVFTAVARLRLAQPNATGLSISQLGWRQADWFARLAEADRVFRMAFGTRLVAVHDDGLMQGDTAHEVRIANGLLALLGPPLEASQPTALLSQASFECVMITIAAARSKVGHHLALRCGADDRRGLGDFAAHIAAAGVRVIVWRQNAHLPSSLLTAELYGGGNAVVVVDGHRLADEGAGEERSLWPDTPPESLALIVHPDSAGVLPWLTSLRTTYVWGIPENGALPRQVRGFVGACFGPLSYDPDWRTAHIKGLAPGIDAQGMQLLLSQVEDPRDARAMARLALAVARAGLAQAPTINAALSLVVAPRNGGKPQGPPGDTSFDPALIACEPDGLRLFSCGNELAKGGRVLIYGPPGGGKSTAARILAARISEASGGGAPIIVTPATLLARGWGATERLVAALWQDAHKSAAPLVSDEFDSMGGVREADAPTWGNGHLVRVLTNEWLRQIDTYPQVPLIVTVNDLQALDPAVRRRFPIAIEVRDELSPAQELAAWASIFGMAPPPGWLPSGACVADFASARERCQLLGYSDAKSHAAAVAAARAVRLGPGKTQRRQSRKTPMH